MAKVRQSAWDAFRKAVNDFAEDAFQQPITWKRSLGGLDRYGEDNLDENFENIELRVLSQYNYFRAWPLNKLTETGALDGQSLAVFFNKQVLLTLGYIDANGNFMINEQADYFILNGIKHKPSGTTDVSQAKEETGDKDGAILTMLVLRRLHVD